MVVEYLLYALPNIEQSDPLRGFQSSEGALKVLISARTEQLKAVGVRGGSAT